MLSVAKAAARDASDLILYANETDRKSSNKSTITDLVTETDKKAEQVIIDDILAKFPIIIFLQKKPEKQHQILNIFGLLIH